MQNFGKFRIPFISNWKKGQLKFERSKMLGVYFQNSYIAEANAENRVTLKYGLKILKNSQIWLGI